MLSTHRMVAPGSPYSHLPGLMGPMVAAFVVAALPGGALRDWAASLIRWPIRPDLVLALTLAAPLIAFGCIAFAHVFGGAAWPDTAALSAYPGLPKGLSTLAGIAVVLVLNGFGEEAGWRGWLLPCADGPVRNLSRYTCPLGNLARLARTAFLAQRDNGRAGRPLGFGWAFALVCGAFALSQLYLVSGRSITAVVLWHIGFNFSVATQATSGVPAAVVSTGVMSWGLWAAWRFWREPKWSMEIQES